MRNDETISTRSYYEKFLRPTLWSTMKAHTLTVEIMLNWETDLCRIEIAEEFPHEFLRIFKTQLLKRILYVFVEFCFFILSSSMIDNKIYQQMQTVISNTYFYLR